jgi:hypothetical protein
MSEQDMTKPKLNAFWRLMAWCCPCLKPPSVAPVNASAGSESPAVVAVEVMNPDEIVSPAADLIIEELVSSIEDERDSKDRNPKRETTNVNTDYRKFL